MKKLSAILALTITSFAAQAQLEKGNLMIGGTGSISAGVGKGVGLYGNFGFAPRAGLFVTDRLVLGTGVGIGVSTNGKDAEGRLIFYSGSLQPFARYYFTKEAGTGEVPKKVASFLEAGAGVSGGVFRGNTYGGASAYGMAGVNGFLNKHVAWELNISYKRESNFFNGSPFRSNPIGVGAGLQIFLDRGRRKDASKESSVSDR